MARLFVVSVDGEATPAQRDAFTAYVHGLHKPLGVGFWHHLTSTWLIADPSSTLTAAHLRDKLNGFMPKVNVVVVSSMYRNDWAANSPQSGHAWLHQNLG